MIKDLVLWWLMSFIAFLGADEMTWKTTHEGGFSVSVHFSATHLSIQQNLIVEIQAISPAAYELNANQLKQNLLNQNNPTRTLFKLISTQILKEKITGPSQKNTILFTLQPLIPGDFSFTLFAIPFTSQDTSLPPVHLVTPLFPIYISNTQFFDKQEPMPAPLLSLSTDYPVEISSENAAFLFHNPSQLLKETQHNQKLMQEREISWLGLIALLIALIWGLARPKAQKKVPTVESQLTIEEKTKQSLLTLPLPKLAKEDEVHAYFGRLSYILKEFLEKRFQLKVLPKTTEEFLQDIRINPPFDVKAQETFKQFLNFIDPVKYAHETPSLEACEQARQLALAFFKEVTKSI
jgi:hypothetical protein